MPTNVRPIRDPFEPILLAPDSAASLQLLLDGQNVIDAGASRWLRTGRRFRWPSRLFLTFFVAIGVGTNAVTASFAIPAEYSWAVGPVLAVPVVLLLLVFARQWLLIPRGLLARRRVSLSKHSLLRFTRNDSALLITPLNKLWSARLCRAGRVYRCKELDNRECLALLAAWQSPVPAPALSSLGDYD